MLMQNSGVTNKEHYGMLWYFWSGQWRLYTCKIPMTTEAANLKLRRVSSSEQYSSWGKGYICLEAKHT